MRYRLVIGLVICTCSSFLFAQDVVVTLAPFSPDAREIEATSAATLGAFRFEASVAPAQIDGVTLTWSSEGGVGSKLEAWLDNGDETFSDATDALLANVPSSTTLMFSPPVQIAAGEMADIWIRGFFFVKYAGDPGGVLIRSFAVEIATDSNVIAPGATVVLGTPAPKTNLLTVFYRGGNANSECSLAPGAFGLPTVTPLGILFTLLAAGRLRVRVRIGRHHKKMRSDDG
jgi:hypothetical protein